MATSKVTARFLCPADQVWTDRAEFAAGIRHLVYGNRDKSEGGTIKVSPSITVKRELL